MRFTGNVTTPGQRWDWAQLDDGCRIAYSLTGSGPPLLVVPGWLSHLELDLAIPVQDRFLQALATGRTLIRYDRPGCGLSDPLRGSRTLAVELAAVRSVADAAGADGLDLFGYSLGAAVAACWAADNRGRTRRLVLYGGWVDGQAIGDEHSRKHVLGLVERHWGIGSELLTDLFAPDADAGTRRALAAYQRAASSAGTAADLLRLAYSLDVTRTLPEISTPTLVLHRTDDRAAPIAQGRALATLIRGARFVELPGRSHLPAFGDAQRVVNELRTFLGMPVIRLRPRHAALTTRQLEVAALVVDGLTNRAIAEQLVISERSAESHVERIRLRLGFRSRAQIAAWFVANGAGG